MTTIDMPRPTPRTDPVPPHAPMDADLDALVRRLDDAAQAHRRFPVAACTALAGELLGLRTIYMDTGSGALRTVSPAMVAAVRQAVDLPIIVGGGIRDAATARALCDAGADVLVMGTAFEEDPERIFAMSEAVHS